MNILEVCGRFVISLAIIAALCALLQKQVKAQDLGPIDGTWEGTFNQIHGPGLRERTYPVQTWRITLRNDLAQAFIVRDGKITEVHSGTWKVQRLKTNVIVSGISSGRDNDGEWIETEAFVLLQKAPDILGVIFADSINNANTPLDRDTSKIFSVQTGDFHRVK